MPAFRPRLRALVVGACAVALVAIGAGGTLAASTTPTVYACYNVNGQVAMASIAQCKLAGGGQLVQINAGGVPGPQGPAGATGPTGPTGPAGVLASTYFDLPFISDWTVLYDRGGFAIRGACGHSADDPQVQLEFFNGTPHALALQGAWFGPGSLAPGDRTSKDYVGQSIIQAGNQDTAVSILLTVISVPNVGCRVILGS